MLARMLVPIALGVAGFAAGWFACRRWLPGLGEGRVGDLSFHAVSVLVGLVGALVGLHGYLIGRDLSLSLPSGFEGGGETGAEILGHDLAFALGNIGPVLGLAAAVYLLAPPPDDEEEIADGRHTDEPATL
jgi:hypothetical protein